MDRAKETSAGKLFHEQLRQKVAKCNLAQDGEEGELERERDGRQELAVEDKTAKIVGPVVDHVGICAERVPLMERYVEHVENRDDAEDSENGNRRGKHEPAHCV